MVAERLVVEIADEALSLQKAAKKLGVSYAQFKRWLWKLRELDYDVRELARLRYVKIQLAKGIPDETLPPRRYRAYFIPTTTNIRLRDNPAYRHCRTRKEKTETI